MDRAATSTVLPSPNTVTVKVMHSHKSRVKVMQSFPTLMHTKKNTNFVKAVSCLLAIPTASGSLRKRDSSRSVAGKQQSSEN